MAVSFKIAAKDTPLLTQAVDRAASMLEARGMEADRQELTMDLMACNANGCPIDFPKLLKADDFNFAHDVFGIQRHIDRSTGQLERSFLPRCSKK